MNSTPEMIRSRFRPVKKKNNISLFDENESLFITWMKGTDDDRSFDFIVAKCVCMYLRDFG